MLYSPICPTPTTAKKYASYHVSGGTRVQNIVDVDTDYGETSWQSGHVILMFLCSKSRCAVHLEAFHVFVDERHATFV